MLKRPWSFSPRTISGKWSIALIIAMFILFIFGTTFANTIYQSVPSGDTILEDITARPVLALAMLAGMVVGISAFITGLLAILKQRENALFVYISTLIGALLALFLSGEIFFPHS